jgi:hypothetical protein
MKEKQKAPTQPEQAKIAWGRVPREPALSEVEGSMRIKAPQRIRNRE